MATHTCGNNCSDYKFVHFVFFATVKSLSPVNYVPNVSHEAYVKDVATSLSPLLLQKLHVNRPSN